AKPLGSKAAPTAGLHFTDPLKRAVQEARDWAEVTLHVGLGTFAPLTQQQLDSGHLHEEHYDVADDVYAQIARAKHVTAVGTTSVRTLESIFGQPRNAQQGPTLQGATDILIQPGYHYSR